MKKLITRISSESNSLNYDIEGNANGQSTTMSYRIVVEEDGTEVGNVSISVNSSYYNNQTDEEYTDAKKTFEEKLKSAVEAMFSTPLNV